MLHFCEPCTACYIWAVMISVIAIMATAAIVWKAWYGYSFPVWADKVAVTIPLLAWVVAVVILPPQAAEVTATIIIVAATPAGIAAMFRMD